MTDLERYLFDVAKGRFHSKLCQPTTSGGGNEHWELQVSVTSSQKIAIINILQTFRSSRSVQIDDGDDSSMSLCLSTGTTNATVEADSNKIVLYDKLECVQVITPLYMDFSGCPVMGLPGQNLHIRGYSSTTAELPCATVNYMVLPV